MRVGFVGNGTDKFTMKGKVCARAFILAKLLEHAATHMVSGHSPVGGIDIWAEDCANSLGVALDLKIPEVNQWNPVGGYGYKARNLDIARSSDVLYIILADVYPDDYAGRRFNVCYHHRGGEGAEQGITTTNHVKSGGCWTGKEALKLGTEVIWKVIEN